MPDHPHQGKNPYQQAAGAYGSTVNTPDGRALEGAVLLKAAQKLEGLAARLKTGEKVHFTEVGEVLENNQKLWILFVDDAMNPDHPLPQEIKNNIASLAVFIFTRTRDVMIDPTYEKLQILININRNIAAGLMKRPAASAQPSAPPAKTEPGKGTADSFA